MYGVAYLKKSFHGARFAPRKSRPSFILIESYRELKFGVFNFRDIFAASEIMDCILSHMQSIT